MTKRTKGYWTKHKEVYNTGKQAKERAGFLRINEHVAHVVMQKVGNEYTVNYSVAKFYDDELKKLGLKI